MNEFVAINYITCLPTYRDRFEELFKSRAHAIDRAPGFLGMQVLKPSTDGDTYLVISRWTSEAEFDAWWGSDEFREGHKRAFADLSAAKQQGQEPPMHSRMERFNVVTT